MAQSQEVSQDLFEPYELNYDPETGEILDNFDVIIEELPRVLRKLKHNKEKREKKLADLQKEINRLTEVGRRIREHYDKEEAYFLAAAKHKLESTGEKSLDYAGLGKIRFRKMPVVVDTTVYDELDDDKKHEVQSRFRDLFRVKQTVAPDKMAIKAVLDGGSRIDGFDLRYQADKIEFVEE